MTNPTTVLSLTPIRVSSIALGKRIAYLAHTPLFHVCLKKETGLRPATVNGLTGASRFQLTGL